MRTIVKILAAGASLAAMLSFGRAEVPEMRLKYGTVLPQRNAVSDMDEYFAKKITELSGGKIKVDLYFTRTLGKDEEMLALIAAGAVDITMLQTSSYTETPFLGFMNSLPMVFETTEQVLSTAKLLYSTSEQHKKELKKIDAHMTLIRQSPPYYLLCRSPIKTMQDFKGKKLRAYGAYVPLMWESLGAIPVSVASTELYQALDKGVVDCVYLPLAFMDSYKLYEAGKYLLDFSFGTIELSPVVVPNMVWNKWSPEVRKIVTEAAADAEKWGTAHIDENADNARKSLIAHGVIAAKFEEPKQLRAAVPDMLVIWRKKQEAAGRGQAAQQVVDLTRKALAK